MQKPVLYIFSISHYCEKARWALDHMGIDYEISHLPPGIHLLVAKKLGANKSSLPILVADGQVIQGSAKIIDWAEVSAPSADNRLAPIANRESSQKIEKRLDDILGIHVRRYFYSEALVSYPEMTKPIFSRKLTLLYKLLFSGTWPVVHKRMIDLMDLGPEQGQESRKIVETELDWLDGLLTEHPHFLAGDQFSRIDITAASLLAALAVPMEHPTYADLYWPPNIASDLISWEIRPSIKWTREIYRQYRWSR